MEPVSAARKLALAILKRVEAGAFAAPLLQALDREGLDARDCALVTELVYGTLRRRLYLDHVLAGCSSRPTAGIDSDVRRILHLGLYQLLFLDRVPDHAAVSEAVSMAKQAGGRRAAGPAAFVNAVLRAVASHRDRVPAPPRARPGQDPAAALSIAYSQPAWLVERWLRRFGAEEAERLLEAQNHPAPVALRVNRLRLSAEEAAGRLAGEGVRTRPSARLPEFLLVEEGVPQRARAYHEGLFYIQDEASGLVARLAEAGLPDRGAFVLDACAGPGGKTLALVEAVGRSGLVVGSDLRPGRLRRLVENARRLRLSGWAVVAVDLDRGGSPFLPGVRFDAVLLDAPCSGTGVIRRHPELRYRLGPADIPRLSALQARLLERCAGLVRPGGRLVYSVCSLEREEGAEVIRGFLRGRPDFVLEDPREELPEAARTVVGVEPGETWLETLPHRDGLDGFFAARLRRQR